MNIDKKLRSVFTEDTELPEIVTEKSNAAYEQIRRKCRNVLWHFFMNRRKS